MISAAAAAERLVPLWAVRQELDLVTQAFYTDPGDQSPWLYHRWLLGCLLAHARTGENRQVCLLAHPMYPVTDKWGSIDMHELLQGLL